MKKLKILSYILIKPSFQIVNKNSLFFMGPSFDRYQPGILIHKIILML